MREDAPGDPRELVRERDDRDVAVDAELEPLQPGTESLPIPQLATQDGLGAEHHEAS